MKSTGEPYRNRVVIENIKENARQFTGPDRNGFVFGESSGAKSQLTQDLDAFVKASLNNPSADPVTLSPTKYKVSRRRKVLPGESLSLIAKRFYKDPHLWPLIWFANEQQIGTNYNVVKTGSWLDIPFLSSVTDQMARCRAVDANWKAGFDWR
jgi:nucleoid-associated protein YgaU